MALAAFSTETVYMHASMEGCIQVAAKPLIKIYRIPRDFADSLVNEPDLKQAGIYLLVNRDAHTLYVGQADARDNGNGVLKRMLEQHTKKKEIDQWDVGYAMISGTPQFFGATELNYLERYFYDKAVDVGNYELLNGIKPHSASIGMATQITLQSYTDHAFFLLENVVGCDAFVSKKKTQKKKKIVPATDSTNPAGTNAIGDIVFYVDSIKKDVHAEAVLLEGNKMLVRQGSRISLSSNLANQKRQDSLEKIRQQLITDGTIVDRVFSKDYTFSSPSTEAAVILGTASSGNEKWKDKNGISLGEINSGKGS